MAVEHLRSAKERAKYGQEIAKLRLEDERAARILRDKFLREADRDNANFSPLWPEDQYEGEKR